MINLKIENVTKDFGEFRAVNNLNFDIKSGEFYTFLGPSGCGKTTTLRMIAGFIYPTKGKIFFNDNDVTFVAPNKRNIGMVFQNYALFPHFTVGENVAFGLNVRKVNKTDTKKRVEKALDIVHLSGLSKRKINELSGGQQQRVALARAIVIEPNILILDEPLSNLDAKLREETRAQIRRIQLELGITTVYVTHDQAEALAISDKILILNKGIIQQIGTPIDIYKRPNNVFIADFIGKSNIISGKIKKIVNDEVLFETKDGNVLTGLKKNASDTIKFVEGEDIKIAVRPEAFVYVENASFNNINGTIKLSEFIGTNINYIINFLGEEIKISFVSTGQEIKLVNQEISLHIPKSMIYFVEEELKSEK